MIRDDPDAARTPGPVEPTNPTTEEDPMTITVYTKPGCVQCDATRRGMTSRRIAFETVDLTEDAEAEAKVKELGYTTAPVVIAGKDHWAGYRPDKIKALAPDRRGAGGHIGLDAQPRGRIAP